MDFTTKLRQSLTGMLQPKGPYKNKKQLADALDIDPAQFNRFLSGRQGLNTDTLDKLLPALGVRMTFPGERDETVRPVKILGTAPANHELTDLYRNIPLTTLGAAAKPGFLDDSLIESHMLIYANDPSFRFRTNLVAARIGKSHRHMMPLLCPGDMVVIDKDDKIPMQNGQIYLVRDADDTPSLRRVKAFTNSDGQHIHIFYGDNVDEYPPETFASDDRQATGPREAIVGKVVWMSSDLSEK